MQYALRKGVGSKRLKDEKGGQWEYISRKEYRALKDAEKKIYGDFKKKDSQDAQRQLTDLDDSGVVLHAVGVYRYDTSLSWSKSITGYIPITVQTAAGEQPGYLRIVKTSVLRILLTALIVLGIAAAIFLAWYIQSRKPDHPDLDEAAMAYHVEGVVNQDPNQIMLPGLSTMKLEPGQTHLENVLHNPEGNPCYFRFKLVLIDTGETLYESGLVEPGKAIIGFDINRPLEAGSYDGEVQISTTSLDDGETSLNNGVVAVKLEVAERTEQ